MHREDIAKRSFKQMKKATQNKQANLKDIYIYMKSASRFSRGTVLNTLKQSRINIMRGKKDVTTFPDKPVS